jgi:hypothetical protein
MTRTPVGRDGHEIESVGELVLIGKPARCDIAAKGIVNEGGIMGGKYSTHTSKTIADAVVPGRREATS